MGNSSRNDSCPCGSGKKYKRCCLQHDEAIAANKRTETATIHKLIQAAQEHHHAGRIPQAEALYQQILRIDQNQPDALHLLGIIARDSGKREMAVELIRRAIQTNPSDPNYYCNLGLTYKALNRPDDAIANFQNAIAIKPDYAEAFNNMGNLFQDMARFDEALVCYRKAIGFKPKFAEAHFNFGNALRDQGKLEEAIACYQKCLSAKPDFAAAYCNLGVTLDGLKKTDAAIANCKKAIELKPDFTEAYNNLGGLLKNKRKLDEAIPCFQKALAIKPDYADAYNNLGSAFKDQGKLQEAIACCHKAMSLEPNGLPGLDSAVRLATLYYLQDNLTQAGRMIEFARPILDHSEHYSRTAQTYYLYIDMLLTWWSHANLTFQSQDGTEAMYVIGDSHVLSAHNFPVLGGDKHFICRSRWIEGCKQWHLGNEESNPYKDQFLSIMESIPHDATILMNIGEIDCRPNEGIIKTWKKHPEGSIEEIALATATAYLKYISRIAAVRNLKIIISGVPATNLPLEQHTEEEFRQYVGLLNSFNVTLREHSLKTGFGFLDVYAMTDSGNGISNKKWHLDATHLRPDALTEAFRNHYL
jgi:tetratricopeptide (TPR) repeat protein